MKPVWLPKCKPCIGYLHLSILPLVLLTSADTQWFQIKDYNQRAPFLNLVLIRQLTLHNSEHKSLCGAGPFIGDHANHPPVNNPFIRALVKSLRLCCSLATNNFSCPVIPHQNDIRKLGSHQQLKTSEPISNPDQSSVKPLLTYSPRLPSGCLSNTANLSVGNRS